MALIDLVMHFGRTLANIARDICRPEIIGRDAHIIAGTVRGRSHEFKKISFDRNVDADQKTEGKLVCWVKSLYGKLDEKSITAIVLPIISDSPPAKSRRIIDDLAFGGLHRLSAKKFLNATKIFTTAPLNRGICTLVNPMKSGPTAALLPTKYPLSKQFRFVGRARARGRCAEWCGADPCDLMRADTVKRPSMWLDPNCYNKLVCKRIFRHDIVHMPGSDKATREYQQTWVECPPIRIVQKPVCCNETLEMPPICRRPRKERPPTATCVETDNVCKKMKDSKCPKIDLPCCDPVRKTLTCKIFPTPSCCQKRCTPFPSFSECCRPESNKKAPVECFCLARPTMCEVYADWRKKNGASAMEPVKFPPFP